MSSIEEYRVLPIDRAVYRAVWGNVNRAVEHAVFLAVDWAVSEAVNRAVWGNVNGAVEHAVWVAVGEAFGRGFQNDLP